MNPNQVREALQKFMEAGYGNSTDFRIQGEAFDLARAALAISPPVEGWISVEDRLPPACTDLLVFGGRHHRATFYYTSTRPKECVQDDKITHWMPLPTAPNNQEAGTENVSQDRSAG